MAAEISFVGPAEFGAEEVEIDSTKTATRASIPRLISALVQGVNPVVLDRRVTSKS